MAESLSVTTNSPRFMYPAIASSTQKLKLKNININQLIEDLLPKFCLRVEDKGGQVFGHLDAMQDICTAARRAAKQAGRPVDLALHRAFDVCRDATLCLEAACELGLATVLTSGQASDAWTGRALLARLQEQAGGRIEILAGSGVNARNIPGLVRETGVTACHLSGKKRVPSRMVFRREGVPMGLPGFDEFELWQTDADAIRAARLALDSVPL